MRDENATRLSRAIQCKLLACAGAFDFPSELLLDPEELLLEEEDPDEEDPELESIKMGN